MCHFQPASKIDFTYQRVKSNVWLCFIFRLNCYLQVFFANRAYIQSTPEETRRRGRTNPKKEYMGAYWNVLLCLRILLMFIWFIWKKKLNRVYAPPLHYAICQIRRGFYICFNSLYSSYFSVCIAVLCLCLLYLVFVSLDFLFFKKNGLVRFSFTYLFNNLFINLFIYLSQFLVWSQTRHFKKNKSKSS